MINLYKTVDLTEINWDKNPLKGNYSVKDVLDSDKIDVYDKIWLIEEIYKYKKELIEFYNYLSPLIIITKNRFGILGYLSKQITGIYNESFWNELHWKHTIPLGKDIESQLISFIYLHSENAYRIIDIDNRLP